MAITRTNAREIGAASGALTNPVAVGDLILLIANYSSTAPAPVVNDNLNSGDYVVGNFIVTSNNAYHYYGVFYKVCTAAGTPTISLGGSGSPQRFSVSSWTGFLGTPTVPSADFGSSSGTTTAGNTGTFTASVNNEYAISMFQCSGGTNPPNPYTSQFNSPWGGGFQDNGNDTSLTGPVAAGTKIGGSFTLPAADNWNTFVQGFYDSGANDGARKSRLLLVVGASLWPFAWIIDRRNRLA